MHFCEWTLPILINISLYFVLHFTKGGSQWFNWPVTVKITGPRTTAGKTHVWPVHLLYISMFKIRKSKPNSDSKAQKFSPWLIDSVGSGNGSCKIPPLTGIEQEWHLKRLNTLGGLEIGIQHQIVNTLELSNPPPPPQKKKEEKNPLHSSNQNLVEKVGRTVKESSDLKISSIPLQCLEALLSSLSLFAVLLILFLCHVHSLSQSHFQYCCQSI